MFPYVPYLYPLMILLCKQKIVFPLPSVRGHCDWWEKDTALRSFSVLLINGVCRQPGWSLSYLVPITTVPRYFPLAFVCSLSPLPSSNLHPSWFFLSASQFQWSNKNLQRCKRWHLFGTASYQCMLLQESSGQDLEGKPQMPYGINSCLISTQADLWLGECVRTCHSFLEVNTSTTPLGCTCSQDVTLCSLQAVFGGPMLPVSKNSPCPSLCSPKPFSALLCTDALSAETQSLFLSKLRLNPYFHIPGISSPSAHGG